jgi:hypothetical protein
MSAPPQQCGRVKYGGVLVSVGEAEASWAEVRGMERISLDRGHRNCMGPLALDVSRAPTPVFAGIVRPIRRIQDLALGRKAQRRLDSSRSTGLIMVIR